MWRFALLAWLAGCGRFSVDDDNRAADAQAAPVIDAADPLLRDCALYMPMNETAWTSAPGEVIDSCGGHNGTAVNGATIVDDPVRGRVGSFPDNASCVNVADSPGLRPTTGLTVSAWIQPMTLDGSNAFGILGKRVDYLVDSAYTIFVWTDGTSPVPNEVFADIDTENDRSHGASSIVNGQWHHIAVVYDGTQSEAARVQFYLDGRPDGTIAETSASIAQFTSSMSIGCMPLASQPTDQQSLHGELDDVAIWMRPLSATEIAAWVQRTNR